MKSNRLSSINVPVLLMKVVAIGVLWAGFAAMQSTVELTSALGQQAQAQVGFIARVYKTNNAEQKAVVSDYVEQVWKPATVAVDPLRRQLLAVPLLIATSCVLSCLMLFSFPVYTPRGKRRGQEYQNAAELLTDAEPSTSNGQSNV
ncbi:hypothetical protein LN521_00330 [Xanthomonas euvesicatoria pv. euvesicatoria]|uniref:hypothetical protein n=2 Tax=Xanthomonas euvesicatoria TaxID=456327 RepID=UPI0011129828|nr:hypothetical protein [Xanthomonas euvesicatoria]MCC8799149.1 hypothetical protein [Xanthomonas euvesicatoria pv. euvesicatoria]MCC8807754.1 hypothetical protein [Xanthomonas euvesicatoria pv. euvesicatoria]MCC8816199.1 hypothetical protein [Xanthomonas euvesicatoria pv. euvesicatoria]